MLRIFSFWLLLSAAAFADLTLPGWENVGRPTATQPIRGRLNTPGALFIQEGQSIWKPATDQTPDAKTALIEFWLKPMEWDAWKEVRVSLTQIKAGGVTYEVVKPADASELHLIGPEGTLQLYPLYSWDEARWSKKLNRRRPFQKSVGWHHFAWHLSERGISFYVDGFPARTVQESKASAAPQSLEEFTLDGAPGTAFESLYATSFPVFPAAPEVRQRYLTSLRSEPDFESDHLNVPYLSSAPVIDGQWSGEEWQGATRLSGFGAFKEHRLLSTATEAYMGYDDKALYVALIMPDRKRPDSQTIDLLLGPPFVSGEEPRRLYQFTGSLSGERKTARVLPTRQEGLSQPWEWKVSRSNGRLIAEAALPFGEADIPERPAAGELWSWNVASRQGGFAWIAPGKLGLFDTLQEIGTLRFERGGTVVRPGQWKIAEGSLAIGLELYKEGDDAPKADVELRLFSEGKVFPTSVQHWSMTSAALPISLPLGGSEGGWATLELRDSGGLLYRHSIRLPSAKKARTSSKP